MDSFVLKGIVRELNDILKGGRVLKVHQPLFSDLLLRIRLKGVSENLLISSHKEWPRIHLTEKLPKNPPVAPSFCMLLRKHIQGGIIQSIEQEGLERVISFSITRKEKRYYLIAEMIGQQSNIVLTDENQKVLGMIRPVPSLSGRERLSIGSQYTSPPFKKHDPLSCTESEFLKRIDDDLSENELWKNIVKNYRGISPLIAKEIVYRALRSDDKAPLGKRLWRAFREMLRLFSEEKFTPILFEKREEGLFNLSSIPLRHLESWDTTECKSISEAARRYYEKTLSGAEFKRLQGGMLREIKRRINKEEKIEAICEEEIKKYEESDKFKIYGELILAHLKDITKGMDKISLTNYYSPDKEPIEIPLDHSLSPKGNAEKYFKRYKKAKRGIEIVSDRLKEIKSSLGYLKETLMAAKEAEELSGLLEIQKELKKKGVIRETGKKEQKREKRRVPFRRFLSKEGWTFLVGKDAKGNEYITNVLGNDEDLWLHVQGTSGSHVIVKKKKRREEIPPNILSKAAGLAAHFSRAKHSSKVPVVYTPVKNVRRVKGKKAGAVSLLSYKTILIKPDAEEIENLKEIY